MTSFIDVVLGDSEEPPGFYRALRLVDWNTVNRLAAERCREISATIPKQEPPKTFEEWAMRRHYARQEQERREDFAHMHGDRTGEFS